jgi:hypothetical protein
MLGHGRRRRRRLDGPWESDEAFAASFAAVRDADVDVVFDERERRPRQIFKLRPG